jgi:hypothetical protein
MFGEYVGRLRVYTAAYANPYILLTQWERSGSQADEWLVAEVDVVSTFNMKVSGKDNKQ